MARKKAEPKEVESVARKKAEPKVPQIGDAYPGKKTIPELLDELHARFTEKLGESYRARDCARKVNKIKRLVGADEVLKG
jgi:hypothetical protein